MLALALGVIAAAWYFSRSDTKQVPSVVGLALDDAVSRLQDDGFRADIGSDPFAAVRGTVFHQTPGRPPSRIRARPSSCSCPTGRPT